MCPNVRGYVLLKVVGADSRHDQVQHLKNREVINEFKLFFMSKEVSVFVALG